MAYFVARTLHMKPTEILETWSEPELVVAYGHYANEISRKNYEEWKAYPPSSRDMNNKPKQYNVRFFGVVDG